MLRKKRLWLSLLLATGFFTWLFWNVRGDRLWEALRRFQILWILPALAVYMAGWFLRVYRWGMLLAPVKRCSYWSLFPTLFIGFTVNNLFPARVGEIVRAHLNGRKEGISRSASLATILLERVFDGLAILLLLTAALSWARLPEASSVGAVLLKTLVRSTAWLFGAAFLACLMLILFKERTRAFLHWLSALAPRRFRPAVERITHAFVDGLKVLADMREAVMVLGASVLTWTCEFAAFWLVARGFGLSPEPLNLWAAALLMAAVNLAVMVPSSPGGIGLFEATGVVVLSLYGVAREPAVAYMLFVHLLVLVPVTAVGLAALSREGLTLQQLGREGAK